MRNTIKTLLLGIALSACAAPAGSSVEMLNGMGCTTSTDPRACDPADLKKTTVCHIPPGNPANAHTICVGNAAVPAHLDHGDFVGECSCPGGGDVDAGTGSGSDTPDASPAPEVDAGDVGTPI